MDHKSAVVVLSLMVALVLFAPFASGQTSGASGHSSADVFRWLRESGSGLLRDRSQRSKNESLVTYGVSSKEPSPREEHKIARGRDVAPGEWPFVALIADVERESICTGTLVAPDWVLTAAHCLVDENGSTAIPSDVGVIVGHDLNAILNSLERGDASSVRLASKVVPHPQYSRSTLAQFLLGSYDIGLIQLNRPFPITPIRVLNPVEANRWAPSGTNSVAVGWGQTENGEIPDILQQVSVPLFSLSECRRLLAPLGAIPDRTFCAGTAAEGARPGDSGGPLLVRFGSGWGQVGVASTGSANPELLGFPATYVSTAAHYDWIHQHFSSSGGGPGITLNRPSNLTATAIGSSQIRLTWRDNSTNESGFQIERRASGTNWSVLVWTSRNRTMFVDAGLNSASTYSYRVAVWNDDATSAYSNSATATTSSSGGGGGGEGTISLSQWVIPTMANSPGRFGAYYRTKVILWNFNKDLELTIRLYGPGGAVASRHLSIEANFYRTWNNFLEEIFDYRGAGAVEFSGDAPFKVSAEVFTRSSEGTYTTVVHNGLVPLIPYMSRAASVGVVSVDGATRTNAGVFNNSNRSQTVSAEVYYPESDSEDPDQTITFSLPPKGWAQKPVSARGTRGYIIWRIPREAYLWVVSVDNGSNDGTLAVPTPLR